MSKIIASLIEAIITDPFQIDKIVRVLEYLGYSDQIVIRMTSRINSRFVNEILSSKNPTTLFEEPERHFNRVQLNFNKRFFYNEDGMMSKKKVARLVKILEKIQKSSAITHGFSQILINRTGVHPDKYAIYDSNYFDDLLFMLKSGIVRLQDVTLAKMDTNFPFSISEASSGEQSVVISILGIASQISDYSLICIDEPEICLHPEWQERYMKILTSTFSMYKGCHFIIATHSPQILANMNSENSFLVSMETGLLLHATEVVKHSADYQLAKILNSPGYKNEFLSRIALNTFIKVGKKKTFDVDDKENYELLKSKCYYLQDDDPILDLFNAIRQLYNIYG